MIEAGPEPAASALAAAEEGRACPVCAFRDRSVERRLFFVVAEGISDGIFLAAFAAAAGYCPRHSRHVEARAEGDRYGFPYRYALASAGLRLAARERIVLTACPICVTETWAEDHVLWALGSDVASADVSLQIPPDALLCVRHASRLVRSGPSQRYRRHRERLTAAVGAAVSEGGLADRLTALAGADPDRDARADRSEPRPDGGAWERGVITLEGLLSDLGAGHCPACSAASIAVERFFRWLGSERLSANDLRELDRLCAWHAWDALQEHPLAVERALAWSQGSWSWRLEALPATVPAPGWLARWRGAGEAEAIARALRDDECRACRAACTAVERTAALLDAALAIPSVARAYGEGRGLCLRHLGRIHGSSSPGAAALLAERARAVVGLLVWELDEALRKSSWSVRYEQSGPEAGAWRRAMAFAAGDAALARPGRFPDPARPQAAI